MAQDAIEFWYEFASTYSYVAMERVRASSAEFRHQPFLLGPVFAAQGLKDSPFNVFPLKGQYMWRDMERLCAELGAPFKRPSSFPRGSLLATRVALAAADEAWLPAFAQSVYRANFAEDRAIAETSVVIEILADLAQDAPTWIARAESPDGKQALKDQTARAQQLNIFGAPSFLVHGELFWGSDRIEQAIAWSHQ